MNSRIIIILLFICNLLLTKSSKNSKQHLYLNNHPDLRDLLYNNVTSESNPVKCKDIIVKYGINDKIQCCKIQNKNNYEDDNNDIIIKCVPHFIIAGTQKSGTTALSAYLSSQSFISFSPRKELHYFDKDKNYKRGIKHYLKGFNNWNYTNYDEYYPKMYGESSPFYIASRYSCKRITETIPNAKLIILLRNPISRMYSEYHMKKRRVDVQNEFIEILNNNKLNLFNCLHKYIDNKIVDLDKFKQCLDISISEHTHYNKFILAIKVHIKYYSNKKRNLISNSAIKKCFSEDKNNNRRLNNIFYDDYNTNYVSKNASNNNKVRNRKDSNIDIGDDDIGDDELKKVMNEYEFYINYDLDHDNNNNNNENRKLSTSRFNNNKLNEHKFNPIFKPKLCLGKYGSETLPTLDYAFRDEIKKFQTCAGNLINPSISTLQTLDEAIQKCVDIKLGISKQYYYRSMYVVQLYNCFKYIPRYYIFILIH
jgi:hypothetical protein